MLLRAALGAALGAAVALAIAGPIARALERAASGATSRHRAQGELTGLYLARLMVEFATLGAVYWWFRDAALLLGTLAGLTITGNWALARRLRQGKGREGPR